MVLAVLLVVGLLLESLWPSNLRKYFNLYYYFTIFYCVPFVAIMTTLHDAQGGFAVSNIVLAIILLILLVDWRTFLGFFFFAGALSMVYFKVTHGVFIPDFGQGGRFVLSMNVIYSLIVCLIFARKKQLAAHLRTKKLWTTTQEQATQLAVQREAHHQLAISVDHNSSVVIAMKEIAAKMQQGKATQEDASRLEGAIAHITQMKAHSIAYLPLKPKVGSIRALLRSLFQKLQHLGIEEQIKIISHLPSQTR